MKLTNLDAVMKDHENKDFEDGTTLRKMLLMAATAGIPGSALNENPEVRYTVGMASVKIQKARRHVFLDEKEISALKARIGVIYAPSMVMRLYDALDGKDPAEKRLRAGEDVDEVMSDEEARAKAAYVPPSQRAN